MQEKGREGSHMDDYFLVPLKVSYTHHLYTKRSLSFDHNVIDKIHCVHNKLDIR